MVIREPGFDIALISTNSGNSMRNTEAEDEFWRSQAQLIRTFLDARSKYEKLAEEVAYILEKSTQEAAVEFAHITHRAKTLDSFCEKASRKGYKEPLKETSDIAGVRIVFLYLSDRPKFEAIVEHHFQIIEKVDKVEKDGPERFGYGALHYVVKLGKQNSGARYDDLKGLSCEIQVRSILQDAWAVVGHHLSYKQESDVPKTLRRKLSALSGLFETVDDQFDRLRDERASYAEEVKKQIAEKGPEFLKSEINLENLVEFLKWRFPDREQPSREQAAGLLSEIAERGYTRLAQVNDAVTSAQKALEAYEADDPPFNSETLKRSAYTAAGAIRVTFGFIDDIRRKSPENELQGARKKFLHLVEDPKAGRRPA